MMLLIGALRETVLGPAAEQADDGVDRPGEFKLLETKVS